MGALEGRSVIVTGAASGIGAASVRRLVDDGARVVAADLGPSAVPDGVLDVPTDVTDAAAVDIRQTIEKLFRRS